VNIGWIFGSVAAFSVVWGYFFFPELKVRFQFLCYVKS
jgi:MFS transporter, SP family, sugar:H+ symporter